MRCVNNCVHRWNTSGHVPTSVRVYKYNYEQTHKQLIFKNAAKEQKNWSPNKITWEMKFERISRSLYLLSHHAPTSILFPYRLSIFKHAWMKHHCEMPINFLRFPGIVNEKKKIVMLGGLIDVECAVFDIYVKINEERSERSTRVYSKRVRALSSSCTVARNWFQKRHTQYILSSVM